MSSIPMKTPLLDLLRDVPKDARGSWPTQWSDDGRETGHAMTPYGRLCHEAADQLKDLKAENARLRKSIEDITSVAVSAVEHVGFANYPEREHEALGWVDEAYARALQHTIPLTLDEHTRMAFGEGDQ